jgi:hypothetical protein
VALVDPAGTVTLAGTEVGEPLVHSWTTVPPVGAGTVRVTVPVAASLPGTFTGFTDTETTDGGDVTVTIVVTLAPFKYAVIVSGTLVAV